MTAARATLVRTVTADGLVEMHAGVPIGRVYTVDLDSVREAVLYNHVWEKHHTKTIIDCVDLCGCHDGPHVVSRQWVACELLRIEARE